jgi:hypothetical protein
MQYMTIIAMKSTTMLKFKAISASKGGPQSMKPEFLWTQLFTKLPQEPVAVPQPPQQYLYPSLTQKV